MILRHLAMQPLWLISQIIPPSLLTYFYLAWKRCTFEVGPYVDQAYSPLAGCCYRIAASAFLIPTFVLFMRLYLLPRTQSIPPYHPPVDISSRTTIFECLAPEEAKVVKLAAEHAGRTTGHEIDDVVVNRCWKGKCNGRWKPARARHCSECNVCRAGFDHHCAFFANCLTTPYIPTFLLTLLLAPTGIITLCLPIFRPFARRFLEAFRLSWSSDQFKWWWDWWPSWVIAGGPLGRYGGATVLAWREMDRQDGGGLFRLSSAILIALGIVLSCIASALGYTTIRLTRAGHLTIDRERARAHSRTKHAIAKLETAGQPIPTKLTMALQRFADIKHFYIPLENGEGEIVATVPGENPYDLGPLANWGAVMGPGLGWLLPWRAIRRGMGDEIYNWPISPAVKARLVTEAERQHSVRTINRK